MDLDQFGLFCYVYVLIDKVRFLIGLYHYDVILVLLLCILLYGLILFQLNNGAIILHVVVCLLKLIV